MSQRTARRRPLLIAALAAGSLTLMLSACGGDSSNPETVEPVVSESGAPEAGVVEKSGNTEESVEDEGPSDAGPSEIAPGIEGTGVEVEGLTTDENGDTSIDRMEVGEGASVTFE